jgi:hypothetical protein
MLQRSYALTHNEFPIGLLHTFITRWNNYAVHQMCVFPLPVNSLIFVHASKPFDLPFEEVVCAFKILDKHQHVHDASHGSRSARKPRHSVPAKVDPASDLIIRLYETHSTHGHRMAYPPALQSHASLLLLDSTATPASASASTPASAACTTQQEPDSCSSSKTQ